MKLDPKLLPIPNPPLPSLEDLANSEDPEKLFKQWEIDFKNNLDENEAIFQKARRKINLCAFLKGFTWNYDFHYHYKWCPAPHWMNAPRGIRVKE